MHPSLHSAWHGRQMKSSSAYCRLGHLDMHAPSIVITFWQAKHALGVGPGKVKKRHDHSTCNLCSRFRTDHHRADSACFHRDTCPRGIGQHMRGCHKSLDRRSSVWLSLAPRSTEGSVITTQTHDSSGCMPGEHVTIEQLCSLQSDSCGPVQPRCSHSGAHVCQV